jgi:hypothetical protein
MRKIFYLIIFFQFLGLSTAISQCPDSGVKEIDCVTDSIVKLHKGDEFYFYVRFLPSVRMSIDEFTLSNKSGKWNAKYSKTTFKPPPWKGTNRTKRKRKLTATELKDSSLTFFVNSIDVDKLINYFNTDSVHLDNSELLQGTYNYLIIICSKSKVKVIEYPVVQHYDTNQDWRTQNIYWQSTFLDKLLETIKQRFPK